MKISKLSTICSLIITIFLLSSFIFRHTAPLRVAKYYSFWHGNSGDILKESTETKSISDDKKNVEIRLVYKDGSISGMSLHKTNSGFWFIIPNSAYSF